MIKYYTPRTTVEICSYFKVNEDAIVELRVESGQRYLIDKYGEDIKVKIQGDTRFWFWYLRIWESIDKRFLLAAIAANRKYTLNDYTWFHYYNGLTYEINNKILSNILSNHKIEQQ